MSFVAIGEAIRERFRTLVAVPAGIVVVNANAPPAQSVPKWCQMTVEFNNTQQVSTGGATAMRYRISGRIALNLFDRTGNGEGSMLAIMDTITTAFRGVSLADPMVSFGAPTLLGASVRDEAGGYWRMPAQVPFRADVFGQ